MTVRLKRVRLIFFKFANNKLGIIIRASNSVSRSEGTKYQLNVR